jgi:predicted DNA-binding transcriptional regulator YafY
MPRNPFTAGIDPACWRGAPGPQPPAPELAVLQQAVLTGRRLRLRYRHGRDHRVRTYTLDPYGLVNKTGVCVRTEILAMFLRVHAADLAPADSPPPEPDWTPVELRFRSLYAAEALLAFGPDVEVLTPGDLRQGLARKAAATAALYNHRPDI